MKLKNLFTCTVTGLLLCTSCIKDEAPNAEADILNCILPAEMVKDTSIRSGMDTCKMTNSFNHNYEISILLYFSIYSKWIRTPNSFKEVFVCKW